MAGKFSLWGMLGLDTSAFKTGINGAKKDTQGFVNAAEGMSKDITKAFKDISTMGVGEMRRNLVELKNIKFAGKTAEEIALVNKQIGILTDEMGDLRAVQKGLGTEFGTLAAKGLQAFGAIVEAGFGVATMFGASEEQARKYQQVMTNMIGVMQGVGVLQDALETKLFQTIGTKIKDIAVTVGQKVATLAATAAQWAYNASLVAITATIGAAVVVVGALTYGLYKLVAGHNEAVKAAEAQKMAEWELNQELKNLEVANDHMLKMAKARGASEQELKQLEIGSTYAALQAIKEQLNAQLDLNGVRKKGVSEEERNKLLDKYTQTNNLLEEQQAELVQLGKTSKDVSGKMVKDAKDVYDAWYTPTDTGYSEKLQTMAEAFKKDREAEQKFIDETTKLEEDLADKSDNANNEVYAKKYANMTKAFLQAKTPLQQLNKELKNSGIYANIATDGIAGIGDSIISMAEGSTSAFKDLITSMLGGIRNVINGLLAEAIAASIAGEAHKGLIGLITASVAVAGITALWQSKVPKFANGGIVGGSSFSGDKIPVRVNSKEMILNQTQQANLFAMANGAGGAFSGELTTKISGNDILVVLNRTGKKINNTK